MLKAETDQARFQEWVKQANGDIGLDIAEQKERRLSDSKASCMIEKAVGTNSAAGFQAAGEGAGALSEKNAEQRRIDPPAAALSRAELLRDPEGVEGLKVSIIRTVTMIACSHDCRRSR